MAMTTTKSSKNKQTNKHFLALVIGANVTKFVIDGITMASGDLNVRVDFGGTKSPILIR